MRGEKPSGFNDLLPREANLKRTLEVRLAALFQNWGYQEVVTPVVEYYETMQAGGLNGEERTFKFIDPEGRILALRPDMTTPIARVASTRLAPFPRPLRLFYLANVFRHSRPGSGQAREFSQAGIELVGAGGALADAEVMILALEALRLAGLEQVELGLGHTRFLEGLFDQVGLGPSTRSELKAALQDRDHVRLDRLISSLSLAEGPRTLLDEVLHFRGLPSEFEQLAGRITSPEAREALGTLNRTLDQLRGYGFETGVCLDFGLVRDFKYYTGAVFEVYTPGIGVPICGGGRYDNLLEQFGPGEPAIGFAINLSALMDLILTGEQPSEEKRLMGGADVLVVPLAGAEAAALRKAQQLRSQGWSVQLDGGGGQPENPLAYARERGISRVVMVDPAGREQEPEEKL